MPATHERRFGFTLLEVLLVLGILVVLAAIVVPRLMGHRQRALIRTTRISIVGLEGALRMYASEHDGEYPEGTSVEVLELLIHPGNTPRGQAVSPYLEHIPVDAWEQPLFYEYPTTRHATSRGGGAVKPAIWSSGPNLENEDGGGDDINNWTH